MAANLGQMFGLEPTADDVQEAKAKSYANGYEAGVVAVARLNELFAQQYGPNADPDVMRGIADAIRAEI